jgi:hypothetical protein
MRKKRRKEFSRYRLHVLTLARKMAWTGRASTPGRLVHWYYGCC